MDETTDVAVLGSGSTKQDMLESFQDAFTGSILYKIKTADENQPAQIVELLEDGDMLINNGYFIHKSTLETLSNAIDSPSGGVWINFAIGMTNQRGSEIQLVLTAVETNDELAANGLGKHCVTTAQIGLPTEPPYTGEPSPKGRG